MSEQLISTISGTRGIIGKTLHPENALQAGKAFGRYIGGKRVVVGGDSRTSHQMLKSALISGLIATGCEVIDLGIVPTPTIAMAVLGTGAAGAVGITASHNPIEWNGLKFFNRKGEFLTPKEHRAFEALRAGADRPSNAWNKLGTVRADLTWIARHVAGILKLKLINVPAIRRRKFKVVIDAVNGAGSLAGPLLLEKLGCRVLRLNCIPDGRFPHPPEPIPRNLRSLAREVKARGADIGFAVDPDADRLAIVSEQGRPIGEEYTLPFAADYVLAKTPGPMVINLSSSNLNRDVCGRHKCRLSYSKVGEANVVVAMRQRKAVIGGEGNGGVIYPALHYGRDSLVGMALILQYLAVTGKKISRLADDIGSSYMLKVAGEPDDTFEVKLGRLKGELVDCKITDLDGVRFDFPDGWVHVRRSNTEPIYRLIVEAGSRARAAELLALVQAKL